MCLVIDMNTLPSVFNKTLEHHLYYKPVMDWVIHGKGKVVCGGSQYWVELGKLAKFIKLFNQLNRAGKIVKVDNELVDEKMRELKELCDDSDFDDPHIAALLIVSGCKVLCSEDKRSYPYIKRKEWYPAGKRPPKIYTRTTLKKASKILSDDNIAEICMPCLKLKKELADLLIPS
jgi:hypothetical protein